MMQRLLLLAGLLLLGGCVSLAGHTPGGAATRLADPASMLVVTVDNPLAPGSASVGSTPRGYGLSGGYAVSPVASRAMDALSREHRLELVDSWPIQALGVHCAVFAWRDAVSRDEMLRRLAADARVESVQPLQVFRNTARPAVVGAADPHRSLQHAADSLGLDAAHRWSLGAGVRVAVVDTQVDASHPDLIGRIAQRMDLVGEETVAAEAHGTAVSGVIAALGGNGEGILGIAPEAELLGLRACWEQGGGSVCNSFTLARALSVALDASADIVNLSLAGPADPLLSRLLRQLIVRGVFVVGAESPSDPSGFPGGVPGVAVARMAESGALAEGEVLPAPGRSILTTLPGGRYAFLDGSSLAAAHVSGVAALVLSQRPGLAPAVLQATLQASVRPPRSAADRGDPARSPMLNACEALVRVDVATTDCLRPTRVAQRP